MGGGGERNGKGGFAAWVCLGAISSPLAPPGLHARIAAAAARIKPLGGRGERKGRIHEPRIEKAAIAVEQVGRCDRDPRARKREVDCNAHGSQPKRSTALASLLAKISLNLASISGNILPSREVSLNPVYFPKVLQDLIG